MSADFLRFVGVVSREVQQREFKGKPARVILASCAYDTDIDDLWDAISNPERIVRWFLPVAGEFRVGGRYQLQGNAGGRIETCEPPCLLGITWEFGGQMSWVYVTLSKLSDGGTRLELEHIAHIPEEHWNEFGPGAVGVGWDLTLLGLGRHIGSRTPTGPKEAEAWMVSEEGRAFIQRSNEAWLRASIASGTDEHAARAAAGRTLSFYLGER